MDTGNRYDEVHQTIVSRSAVESREVFLSTKNATRKTFNGTAFQNAFSSSPILRNWYRNEGTRNVSSTPSQTEGVLKLRFRPIERPAERVQSGS